MPLSLEYTKISRSPVYDPANVIDRHADEEFEDAPCIDKGFYVLMGNNHYVMQSLQRNEPQRLKSFLGWLLASTKGFAPKLVNPGGVEVWKSHQAGNVSGLDQK